MLNDPIAANAPAANSSESPGKKGVNTKPVSAKMIKNKIAYEITPYVEIICPKCVSMCKMNSMMAVRICIDFEYSKFVAN